MKDLGNEVWAERRRASLNVAMKFIGGSQKINSWYDYNSMRLLSGERKLSTGMLWPPCSIQFDFHVRERISSVYFMFAEHSKQKSLD